MVTVSILVVGIVTAINFGAMSAQAQTTMHGNQTTNGKTMAGNTTGNMRKGNSTSMPTPEGPPLHEDNLTSIDVVIKQTSTLSNFFECSVCVEYVEG